MKKLILRIFTICFIGFFSTAYAGGSIAHMYIAQEAIQKLPDAKLRNLLLDNLDAYLVGAYYPDSGYIKGNLYGEDSHWDGFIYAFAEYIKEKYPDPASQNPKLLAFLFGCAAHRVSDEIIHWTFYNEAKRMEFNGDYGKAHSYGDTGIDLLVNVDKSLWFSQPSTWWVPVQDLVNIYHRMGKDEYTAKQIIWGNVVISFAGTGERMISAPAYPILKWKMMPWTAAHYYDWQKGGILMDVQNVAEYETALWKRMNSKVVEPAPVMPPHTDPAKMPNKLLQAKSTKDNESAFMDILRKAFESGIVSVGIKTNADGSVEFQAPTINNLSKLQELLRQFIAKFTS